MKNLMVSSIYTLLLSTTCLSSQVLAAPESINTQNTLLHLFEIFDGYTIYNNGNVKVRGVELNRNNEEYTEKGNSFIISKSTFDFYHNKGLSTFEATPGDNSNSFGSAFHVGANFLLTNQHVLSTSRRNSTECKRFRIKLNYDQFNLKVNCKKVHYCDRDKDYCLIEMHEYPRGQSLSDKEGYTLSTEIIYAPDEEHYIFGNSRGFGIHASKGKGLRYFNQDSFRFYAPVFGGNSGGPIFNMQGEVIGIVKQQSALLYGEDAYNVGISIKEVLRDLELNLEDKSILEKLNIKNSL